LKRMCTLHFKNNLQQKLKKLAFDVLHSYL
jgi:hypothetical protein